MSSSSHRIVPPMLRAAPGADGSASPAVHSAASCAQPAPSSSGAHASCALLEQRCALVPGELSAVLAGAPPRVPSDQHVLRGRWVVTGIGASEGPARTLAALLRARLGLCAVFAPLSDFALAPPSEVRAARAGDVLVVFTQGLSPNARLALAHRRAFGATLVVTSRRPEPGSALAALADDGVEFVVHGPADESGLLLRVVGPPVATLVACRIANAVAHALGCEPAVAPHLLARLPATVTAAGARADAALAELSGTTGASPLLLGRVAFVTAGALAGELTHGLRWKWLEGLGLGEPPAWDVLQVAHGPFQDFFHDAITLFALVPASAPGVDELFERLARVLHPGRHRVVRFVASQSDVVAAGFEHDAACNRALLRALAARPRDLLDWPGKGLDGPLYELGRS